MNERQQAAQQARKLLQRNSTAVLSTLSKKLQGMPFGSVSPVMLADDGHIIFYVSDIAQHARNLNDDNRLSVTVFDSTEQGDQNTQGRLTLSGRAQVTNAEGLAERYFQRFPAARKYQQTHDFRWWQLSVEHIRFIGGFGEIFWLTPEEWCGQTPNWSHNTAVDMVAHMNDDHADACALIWQQHFNTQQLAAGSVTMSSIYADGFHLRYRGRDQFVPFADAALTSSEVRQRLVSLTNSARAA